MTQPAQIHEFLNTYGKAGPTMTSTLKTFGNGRMEDGIQNIADFYFDSGLLIGNREGWIKGSLTTLIASGMVLTGVYLKKKYDNYKLKKVIQENKDKFITAIKENSSVETIDNE